MKKNAIAIACAAVIALVLVLPLGLAGLLRPQAAVTNQGATQDSGQSASAQAVVPEQQETSAEAASDSSGNSPDEPEYVPGVVLVGISDDASIDQVNERLQQLDYVATKSVSEEELLYGYAEITLAEGVEVDDAVALSKPRILQPPRSPTTCITFLIQKRLKARPMALPARLRMPTAPLLLSTST